MNDSCGTCSRYPETSWHLFLHCEYAVECWRIVGLWGEVERLAATAESFQDWLFAALRDLPEMKMQMLVAVVGGLWIERNGRVWSTERKPAFVTIRGAMEAVREWQGTRRSESGPMLQPADTTCRKWHPPPPGMLKCNVDGAVFGDQGRTGAGMVLRNEHGELISFRMASQAGFLSPKESEGLALLHALKWLNEKRAKNTIIEVDALEVVRAYRSSASDGQMGKYGLHSAMDMQGMGRWGSMGCILLQE
ncbi:hypothetical protein LINPERHAP2_LOCUS14632 [Linum perenne]